VIRKLGIVAACIVAVIGGGVAWCSLTYPRYSYRYRMTVEVDVDGTLRTGSSVIQVTAQKQPVWIWGVVPVLYGVKGEAVFVDLGKGRNVVGLLASGPTGQNVDYPAGVVPTLFGFGYTDADLRKYSTLRGTRDLPPRLLPTFITFTDLDDPKTARVVRPDQFGQVFGPGVRFKRAWIETTNDPATRDIDQKLAWWGRSGRPAAQAYRAWLAGQTAGPAIEPETLFKRN
jgi:hypothetical protein